MKKTDATAALYPDNPTLSQQNDAAAKLKPDFDAVTDALKAATTTLAKREFWAELVTRTGGEGSNPPSGGGSSCDVACRDRARLMDRVSSVFLDMGAEFDDGFTLRGEGCTLRIAALPDTAALRVRAEAYDAETARELALSASELVKELEKRLE